MTNPAANLGSATYVALTHAGGTAVTDDSQYFRKFTPRLSAPRRDTTTFGNGSRKKIAGFKDGVYDAEGVWDSAIHAIMMGIWGGTAAPFILGPAGTATGKAKDSGSWICTDYSYPTTVDEEVTFTATFEVDGNVTSGTF